jgi:RHS repeat-associated protein
MLAGSQECRSIQYNYFRDYDPAIGRYLESDPIGLRAGLNTYGYVVGNPLLFNDPFGLDAVGQAMGRAIGLWGGRAVGGIIGSAEPGGGTALGALIGGAIGSRLGAAIGDAVGDMCVSKDKSCPPCRLVNGTLVPLNTVSYRYDYLPPHVRQHGINGEHFNLYRAQQNPKSCKCFWQPIGASGGPLDPNWIPIVPFAD